MKTLKFSSDQVENIVNKKYSCTWRLFDDKDLDVDDHLEFIDSGTKKTFGYATITKITIKKIRDIDDYDKLNHKSYPSQKAMLADFKRYYGKNVTLGSVVKVIEYDYSQDRPKKEKKDEVAIKEVKIFTDGGSRGNPGPSAAAYVVMDMQENIIKIDGQYLGITTNNQAEYQAVKYALQCAKTLKSEIVHFYMDSLLVVNQMNGIFKIRNRDLWPIHQDILRLKQLFKVVDFLHVPREMNKIADSKVNELLDSRK
ncbi:ribonuclease HI family protein [Candidatus Saccharibacteria bacterium]|jgi:ribonuclease HI|nr:ribonuclease HI family protein [Candidatus Saccharibacteria bacterium]HOR23307.1 ribonuclease HI family protein [Candidatus Saccharibacteria bacterium]